MSNPFEPSLDEMRIELQVLGRAVSTLFAIHPDPTAPRRAWARVVSDLCPDDLTATADKVAKERNKIQCEEFRIATQLQARIGALPRSVD
ncbi:hypothetical protein FHX59_001001 [Paraburkholderia silvatlantica]|uniref:Uncharacterized protein n=1 Tax=Paraburkholderia silvatlantica TaxID=321895 RepID=A0ABR6FGR1_9BURK|nr:hypothetical protein [Paraburkholderia silvatlantica]PVY37768.1 hypothetical protein C7411_101385 [Paraburkholderia silvatlantica]PXW42732.1 hypothetical protein C7413_101387 [Paraburkholderia silvatlantica]